MCFRGVVVILRRGSVYLHQMCFDCFGMYLGGAVTVVYGLSQFASPRDLSPHRVLHAPQCS